MAFVKIHDMLLRSSVLDEELYVRWVWVVLLVLADRNGVVRTTPTALARAANVPQEWVDSALAVLMAPDPNSTTPDEEGRRLLQTGPNEYYVVNYQQYRRKVDPDEERAKVAERVRRHRARKRDVTPVTECNDNAEADADADADTTYVQLWALVPKGRKVGKVEALRLWAGKKNTNTGKRITAAEREVILARYPLHVAMWAREHRTPDKVPHLRTWLYQRRWEDEIDDTEQQVAEDAEWLYGVYRRADLAMHGGDPRWQEYLDYATSYTTDMGPCTAPGWEHWLRKQQGGANEDDA